MTLFTVVFGTDQELLQAKDINKIMKQIFDQHVDKKEITGSILKNSFKVYIDQFDPDRIYLLEQEVAPFLKMSDSEVNRILAQYQQNQFPEYEDLNNVIQKSILRAQKMREEEIQRDAAQLFRKSASYSADGYEDWRDPDLHRAFAKDIGELRERQRTSMVEFIAAENKRYGDKFVLERADQVLILYTKDAKLHENQYLFLSDNGLVMDKGEKENIFIMHVLKALANSLDAHTTVMSSNEASDMRMRLEKETVGIGVQLHITKDDRVTIDLLVDGGPAAKSGLVNLKDQIVKIDGTPVKGKSLNEILEMIRGKVGSTVTLVLKRSVEEQGHQTDKEITVPLVRDEITVDEDRVVVKSEKFGNGVIGIIKLDSFYQSEKGVTSENDVRDAIEKLKKQGNLRGLVLDLRENSGGFLSQAVKVVGLFITNGVVVISKYFNGEEHFYRDMDGKKAYDGPLVVLTSKATASAAEIVAQALQDYGVGVIVGDEHTYGKGSIQSQTVTENKGATFFKVTVGKYYTVSGKTPQVQGVKADVVVPSQLLHENIGEEYLDYPLAQDTIPAAYDDNLADVAANLKSWYMHYYIPSLQHKKDVWVGVIPQLKANSGQRIARNQEYQAFLKGSGSSNSFNNQKSEEEISDLQLDEAVNVLKDMINLQTQARYSK